MENKLPELQDEVGITWHELGRKFPLLKDVSTYGVRDLAPVIEYIKLLDK